MREMRWTMMARMRWPVATFERALLHRSGQLDTRLDATIQIMIEQGVEMGRPSVINVVAKKRGGVVEAVWTSGRCVPVMRGVLNL